MFYDVEYVEVTYIRTVSNSVQSSAMSNFSWPQDSWSMPGQFTSPTCRFNQIHIRHRIGEAIQSSSSLSSSPFLLSSFLHQGLFPISQPSHQVVPKYWSFSTHQSFFKWISEDRFRDGLLISLFHKGLAVFSKQCPVSINSLASSFYSPVLSIQRSLKPYFIRCSNILLYQKAQFPLEIC